MIATVTSGRQKLISRLGKLWLALVLLLFVGSAFRLATPLRFTNPTVQAFTITTSEDTSYVFSDSLFDASFSDGSGATLVSVVFQSLPVSGTLFVGGEEVTSVDTITLNDLLAFTYTPNQDFFGLDSIGWYGITSSDDSTNTVYSFFNVEGINDLPTVSDAVYLIEEDQSLSVSLPVVLSTVYEDVEGDSAISIQLLQEPGNGQIFLVSTNELTHLVSDSIFDLSGVDSIRYSPNPNYFGADTWEWNWSDGEGFSNTTGEVTVSILPVEDSPTVTPITGDGLENEAISLSSVVFQTAFSNPDGGELESIEILTLPSEGEIAVSDSLLEVGDELLLTAGFDIVYTPDGGFVGEDGWQWVANPETNQITGTVSYTVSLPNQGPEVLDVDTVVQEDTPIDFPISVFTSSASDPEGDLIEQIVFTDIPQNGIWTFGDLFGDTLQEDSAYFISNISVISYLPEAHFWGDEEIEFQLWDDKGNVSNTATFKLEVQEVNDPPGRFQFIELEDDTLRWRGQSFTVRWSESEEVDLGDTIMYTWFVNLRDTLIQVSAGTNEGLSTNLDASFLLDPDVFLMWAEASDGEDVMRTSSKIFKIINPAVTGVGDFGESTLLVYPNPAVRQVRVELPADLISEPTIQLFNPLGQLVGAWVPAMQRDKMMDLTLPSALTSGWYTLKLSGKNAQGSMQSWQNKLMIQHP